MSTRMRLEDAARVHAAYEAHQRRGHAPAQHHGPARDNSGVWVLVVMICALLVVANSATGGFNGGTTQYSAPGTVPLPAPGYQGMYGSPMAWTPPPDGGFGHYGAPAYAYGGGW